LLSPLLGFYLLIIFSIQISFCSRSIFMFWIRLEINMLRFLPIISSSDSTILENPIKYFLIQSWSSAFFLVGNLFFLLFPGSFYNLSAIAILLKLGAAPFHYWFISILTSCDIWNLYLLRTFQKIIPVIIYSWFTRMGLLIFVVVLSGFSVIYIIPGSISINKILSLSSVGNLTWIMVRCLMSVKLMLAYILVYFSVLLCLVLLFFNSRIVSFFQVGELGNFHKLIIVFSFMSLGGLPPFLGFFGKLMVIKALCIWFNFIVPLTLSWISVSILYYYISRLLTLRTYSNSMKIRFKSISFRYIQNFYFFNLIIFNLVISLPI